MNATRAAMKGTGTLTAINEARNATLKSWNLSLWKRQA